MNLTTPNIQRGCRSQQFNQLLSCRVSGRLCLSSKAIRLLGCYIHCAILRHLLFIASWVVTSSLAPRSQSAVQLSKTTLNLLWDEYELTANQLLHPDIISHLIHIFSSCRIKTCRTVILGINTFVSVRQEQHCSNKNVADMSLACLPLALRKQSLSSLH